jgi:GPH family glycoside/pentoside/hexuronide:cation symporter
MNAPYVYALGMFAMMIPSQAFLSYYSFFYVERLGLSLGLLALARLIYSIWDAVNNPLMGYFSDRTRTRYGRRRPWIAGAAPLFAASFIMIFTPPQGLGQSGLFWWLAAGLILFEGFATVLWVNYLAIFPEIYRGDRLRAKASAVQQAYQIVAILIATVLTPILYSSLGFSPMSIVFAAVFLLFMFLCIAAVREDPEASRESPLPFVEAFKVTLRNKTFWVFNIANSFAQTVNGMLSSAIPFYAKYVLRIPDPQVSILMAAVFVSVIPLVAVWYWIVKRIGGLRGWRIALLAYALSLIPLGFGSDLYSGITAGVLVGFGLAGFLVTPPVFSGQIIDRDAALTGRRREGIYSAVSGFITRSSGLISAAAFWIVGLVFGYVSGDEPGPNPEATFLYLTCIIPFILVAIAFVISLFVRGFDGSPSSSRPAAPGSAEGNG